MTRIMRPELSLHKRKRHVVYKRFRLVMMHQ
jgi:hypothetical protein